MEPDPVRAIIAALAPEIAETRHYLHQNPELSNQERNTSALVAERLRGLGLDAVQTNVGGYGVVGTLKGRAAGAESGPTFALRADMDALPIQEAADLPYKSCVPGVMHACGHDGHTATLLGTAATLAQLRDRIRGTIKFVFQPAEETVGGATEMCKDGVMEGVDAIVALHGWPGMEVGRMGVKPGPMMASADTFDLTIQGRGAHAAQPHVGIDPIVIGAHVVLALQTLASREVSPTDSVVVTVAQFHAGTAYNIIPGTAELKGTVRCLSEPMRKALPERIERMAANLCAAFRAECTFSYRYGTPVTVNDLQINALVAAVGQEVLGAGNVVELEAPSMGAEDFAVYLHHAPGAMFRLGVGAEVTPLHTPTYNFADTALPVGMELFTRTALRYLDTYS
ncbi:MAG TPA: amidohydrolase [Chthonomonadaceae bacterium]|nr:amidohydrolase [Chthonomonadaceae bacterium]